MSCPAYNQALFLGFHVPGEEHFNQQLYRASAEGAFPHALLVNRAGKRFCDESFYKDYIAKIRIYDGITNTQPNYPPFMIFDQTYRNKYFFGSFQPGDPIPEDVVPRADTVRGLAEKLGIDADNLEVTIERFNGFVEQGKDEDFGRGEYP